MSSAKHIVEGNRRPLDCVLQDSSGPTVEKANLNTKPVGPSSHHQVVLGNSLGVYLVSCLRGVVAQVGHQGSGSVVSRAGAMDSDDEWLVELLSSPSSASSPKKDDSGQWLRELLSSGKPGFVGRDLPTVEEVLFGF